MIRRFVSRSFAVALLSACAAALAAPATPTTATAALTGNLLAERAAAAQAAAQQPQAGAQPLPAEVPMQAPQRYDYSANRATDVFGAALFSGSFALGGATQFNPDYLVAIGDRIQVRIWGGFSFDGILVVDPQGNLFVPQVGPVKLAGVSNRDLQRTLEAAMRRVFRANVSGYASLAAAQPVRIFVGGFVNRPGMYNGTSMDSLLNYLDQAGGIDPDRGSFLTVQVKRGQQVRATINLYDFLLDGTIPQIQLSDGDVIFVAPRQSTVRVSGLAANAKRFEFTGAGMTIEELARLAKPSAAATHVRVVRNTGVVRNTDYYALADARAVRVGNGDDVEFTADKKPGTITVRVEGEHQGQQEYVLPYGSRIGALLGQVRMTPLSDAGSIQLYRVSVRERQRAMLQTSMRSLESAVLTARSGTSDEAVLRKQESDLILQWVERAKKIEPSGQVQIASSAGRDSLLLENGDVIRIPTRDGLVLVSGEVMFPNAVAFERTLKVGDYIARAGGYTQNAESSKIVVAHRDGSFEEGGNATLRPGDEVLVLPKVDVKSRQIFKDMTQIIYQIAIAAKVVLGL
ncbi:polysaccharide biosynthesis/export family protein [Massilia niastensis]|uniref:polysaccharide biosynthesis/export family protein n=1 Tax=Massilia niastensis TaxID=544911 RepID=UPI00036A1CD1|nr:polysaccharide biosynthesis/export family protein [Massilia niastensis]